MLHSTEIRCSHRTAYLFFLTIGILFILTGCTQVYKSLGMNEEQVAAQVAADQETTSIAIHAIRATTTETITTIIAGVGTILSAFLAKWLGTERKITKAIITGIEDAEPIDAKKSIQKAAQAAGVEKLLNKRVQSLT